MTMSFYSFMDPDGPIQDQMIRNKNSPPPTPFIPFERRDLQTKLGRAKNESEGSKSQPTAGFLNQPLEHMNQMHRQTADSVSNCIRLS